MRGIFLFAVAVVMISSTPNFARAQPPAAVVEDVKGKVAGVEFMDYVTPGQIIDLGPRDSVVLGYISSCIRETIVGGLVSVGASQSTVSHGSIERSKVVCDSSALLSDREASQGAATSFRSVESSDKSRSSAQRPILLHGLSPMVETSGGGTLVVNRIDVKGERREVVLNPRSLVRGKFYDFASAAVALAPGGRYVATLGTSNICFRIDPHAKAGWTPIIGRLLRME